MFQDYLRECQVDCYKHLLVHSSMFVDLFSGSRRNTYQRLNIGVGRFRGGGGKGGQKSQQAHDVVMKSMRRNDVASTSFRRHVPTRFLTNQCQIITFVISKSDIIENSRIELRGIVLPFIIILPFY